MSIIFATARRCDSGTYCAFWDRELRTLYRLASTPEAERRLVTLIDAAVDRDARAFVLALKAMSRKIIRVQRSSVF